MNPSALIHSAKPILKIGILTGLFFLLGCQTAGNKESARPVESVTFAEKRLLDIVKRQEKIMQTWDRDPATYNRDSLEMQAVNLAREYESYLADNPDDLTARILYGKLLIKLDQSETAIRQFLEVDRQDPTLPVVKQQIGNYLVENGRYMAALPYFINARDLDPTEPLYLYQLGTLLYEFRDHYIADGFYTRETLDQEMQSAFAEAVRLDPENFPYALRFAESYYDLSEPDWSGALKAWNHALEIAPSSFDRQIVLLHQARVYFLKGENEKALALSRQVTDKTLQVTRNQLTEEFIQD